MAENLELTKLKTLLKISGQEEDDLLLVFLDLAKQAILDRRYPYEDVAVLPDRYTMRQVRIAEYLYHKQGAVGQTQHSENSVSRAYESSDIPESMLSDIVPMGRVFK